MSRFRTQRQSEAYIRSHGVGCLVTDLECVGRGSYSIYSLVLSDLILSTVNLATEASYGCAHALLPNIYIHICIYTYIHTVFTYTYMHKYIEYMYHICLIGGREFTFILQPGCSAALPAAQALRAAPALPPGGRSWLAASAGSFKGSGPCIMVVPLKRILAI